MFFSFIFLNNCWGSVDIRLEYSESADVFELLDNVSNWNEDFCHPAYKKYWESKFPLTDEDKNLFQEYRQLRMKFFKGTVENNSLFTDPQFWQSDKLSTLFHQSSSVDESIQKIRKELGESEAKFFVSFYRHFKPRASELIRESVIFSQRLKDWKKIVQKLMVKNEINKAEKFLELKLKEKFYIRPVWFPPENNFEFSLNPVGMSLRLNPLMAHNFEWKSEHFTMLFRLLLAKIPANLQSVYTKQFFGQCPLAKGMASKQILEVPLALAIGPMSMKQAADKKNFSIYETWHEDLWVNLFSRQLFFAYQKKQSIGQGFIDRAAQLCSEYFTLGKWLQDKQS